MLLSVLSPTLSVPTAVGRRRMSGAAREVNRESQSVSLAVVSWLVMVKGDEEDVFVVDVVVRRAGGRSVEVEEAVVSVVRGIWVLAWCEA